MRTPKEQKLLDALNNTHLRNKTAILAALFAILTQDPPCSLPRLLYDRLGLPPSAYQPLYEAGGMTITNALSDWHNSNNPNPES